MAFVTKTPEQKQADLARAVKLIQSGKFPKALQYKIMNHTLTLKPTGSTEKGSVTYSGSPGTIEFIDPTGAVQKLRVNRMSVSILGHTDEPEIEMESGSVWG